MLSYPARPYEFATEFPAGGFGNAIRTACQIIANPSGVAVVRVTLSGFDTHANQPGTQAALLTQVANGLVALQAALVELGKWDDTLVLTYAEFGRRPKENQNNGTDHGTANVHFALTIEPKNPALRARAEEVVRLSEQKKPTIPTTIQQEKSYNPFLRADLHSVQGAIGMEGSPPAQVFGVIRARKDKF